MLCQEIVFFCHLASLISFHFICDQFSVFWDDNDILVFISFCSWVCDAATLGNFAINQTTQMLYEVVWYTRHTNGVAQYSPRFSELTDSAETMSLD